MLKMKNNNLKINYEIKPSFTTRKIKELQQERDLYKEVIDKAIECIKNFLCTEEYINVNGIAIADNYAEILEILKDEDSSFDNPLMGVPTFLDKTEEILKGETNE